MYALDICKFNIRIYVVISSKFFGGSQCFVNSLLAFCQNVNPVKRFFGNTYIYDFGIIIYIYCRTINKENYL